MSRYAPTLHTDPARIAALEALLPQLLGQYAAHGDRKSVV